MRLNSTNKARDTDQPKAKSSQVVDATGSVGGVVRKVLLTIAVAGACYVAYGFGRLWAEWREATHPADVEAQASTAEFKSLDAMLPLTGQWSFSQLDWDLRSSSAAPGDVAARLDKLTTVSDAAAETLADVSDDLVQAAKNLNMKPVERGDNQVYALNRPDFKAQLVVRIVAGRTKAVSLAIAYPQSDALWQVIEFTPRGRSGNPDASAGHLLPLPADAVRSGGRYADNGQLLMELVSLNSKADELIAKWKGAGWEVRRSDYGRPENFAYLCARGPDVIYAWSSDPDSAVENLMLVRTPSGADTKP